VLEDCGKVQGKVVGRHEAVVRTPWYLTSHYLSRKLGCPVAQALKRLDQKGYAATWFTREQRQVFWSSWAVRKGAILDHLAHHALRREVARIEAASDLTQLSQQLYQVQQAQPQRYSSAEGGGGACGGGG
jgi:hypothetical protein